MRSVSDLQKIGEGQEAEVFLIGNNKVVKLFKNESFTSKSRKEFELLSLLNTYKVTAPKTYEQISIDNKPGYIMDYIPGYSLLYNIQKNPLQCRKIAKQFATIQVDVNSIKASDKFDTEIQSIKWCIEHTDLSNEYIQYGLDVLGSLKQGDDLCHGDYNLANVLINVNTGPVLIDWGGAAKGYYVSDIANATLMIMNGGLPPNTNTLTKILIVFLRRIFELHYIKQYKRLRMFSNKELHDWQVVRAIARMNYCINDEKKYLFKFIIKCYKNPRKNYLF